MSIFNCHKQEPQPWMSYISRNKITYSGDCCPALVTNTYSLLPFQIISSGNIERCEISVYGSGVWEEITLTIDSVFSEGFYFHSYNGDSISPELECGIYEFRVIAGEMWWFEPIMVEDFEFTENAYKIRDLLMIPFKFSEQQFETLPLIAPCDSILPFMFTTTNPTEGMLEVYLYDVCNNCEAVEIDLDIHVRTIAGMTYYYYEGGCLETFLECGIYKIEIVDGAHSYWSVPFAPECGISDIPDGYRPLTDFNGCVMRDEFGNILTEVCNE